MGVKQITILKVFTSQLKVSEDSALTANKIKLLEKASELKIPELLMVNESKEDIAQLNATTDIKVEVLKGQNKETPSSEGASQN